MNAPKRQPSKNELEEQAQQESAKQRRIKALFVLATGVAPSEYDNLTEEERNAFSTVLQSTNRNTPYKELYSGDLENDLTYLLNNKF